MVKIHTFLGVIWGGLAIAMIFVVIRLFARLKTFKKLFADDFFVIFALILALASAIVWQIFAKYMFQMLAVAYGSPPGPNFATQFEHYSKSSAAVVILFYSTLWAIKISFLIFFKRLGKNVTRQNLLWWPIFGFTMATYFASIGAIPYSCFMDSLDEVLRNCSTNSAARFQEVALKLNCAWDVLTDFTIMLIPISILWGTQMEFRRKLALMFIFSLVIITVVFSILRTSTVASLTRQPDPSWLYMWSAIEATVAIVVSCLASFRSLFLQQDIRSQTPVHYNPPASLNRFLQGSNSGRNRIRDTQDTLDGLTGNASYRTHIHASGGSASNTADSKSNCSAEFIGLHGVHIKQEVDLVNESV
ncbi:hypothetical protein MMC22_011028 [Lobaria immixta]|nr:hypothetical protein [Lobaria immixta]